jgi:Cu/Ag efflux pump CusA
MAKGREHLECIGTGRRKAWKPGNKQRLFEPRAPIREGAVQRVRPKAMTVAVILAGLLPIMLGHGSGSEIMQRITAPMIGGMVTAPLLSMLVIPVVYRLLRGRGLLATRPSQAMSRSGAA